MYFSKMTHEGYLLVDHRNSPGLSEEDAHRMGYLPDQVREGKIYETSTIGCPHCGCVVVKNPYRVRARGHCIQCDKYICDACDYARSRPDYVHRTIDQICDLLRTGRWALSGTMSLPVLTPIQGVIY